MVVEMADRIKTIAVRWSSEIILASRTSFFLVATYSLLVECFNCFWVCLVDLFLGSTFDEAAAACQQCVIEEGRILVHPFDDLDVIAGQGVIGLEILKQHHSRLDAVFIAVGGGGMIAGIGSCFKEIIPDTKIIGVEGVECPGMTESLRAGRIVTLNSIGTFADGAAVKTVGKNTFRICYNGAVIDETILVNTDEICAAIKDSFNDVRVIVEPAGALAIGEENALSSNSSLGILSFSY